MIINIDYTGKVGSTYRCDVCGKKLFGYEVYRVYSSERGTYSKLAKWHMCEKCYGYVEKYVSNVKARIIERRKERRNKNENDGEEQGKGNDINQETT
jgi:hypothetical protein